MYRQRTRELGEKQGLTYSKLARSLGIGMGTAMRLYEDPYATMNTETLYRISKFFGVPYTEVLVEDKDSAAA